MPLSPRGVEQAAGLPARIGTPVDRVYSSDLQRALQTAAPLGSPVALPGLRELDQGELEGRRFREALADHTEFFAQWRKDPSDVVVPGGESLTKCQVRMWSALIGAVRPHGSNERVVVVSHQMALATVLCKIDGAPLSEWTAHRLDNAGIAELEWNGSDFRRTQ